MREREGKGVMRGYFTSVVEVLSSSALGLPPGTPNSVCKAQNNQFLSVKTFFTRKQARHPNYSSQKTDFLSSNFYSRAQTDFFRSQAEACLVGKGVRSFRFEALSRTYSAQEKNFRRSSSSYSRTSSRNSDQTVGNERRPKEKMNSKQNKAVANAPVKSSLAYMQILGT